MARHPGQAGRRRRWGRDRPAPDVALRRPRAASAHRPGTGARTAGTINAGTAGTARLLTPRLLRGRLLRGRQLGGRQLGAGVLGARLVGAGLLGAGLLTAAAPGLSAAGAPAAGAPVQSAHLTVSTRLPRAAAPPAPAPPSVASAPPLQPHEIFGFAPYWTLGESPGFDVARLTTIAYFGVSVNADGSLQRSGPGWTGLQSQALATLIGRAHAAGDRVVLTVTCFSQSDLDRLVASRAAARRLGSSVLGVVRTENLDGVNIDFEGVGGGDRAGLTAVVAQVARTVHQADAHYQVTVDTYASSAAEPGNFFDVPALAAATDGVVAEEYGLDVGQGGADGSPLTRSVYSDRQTIAEYTAVMPAAKLILAVPYFGYDWATSDGTLAAHAESDPAVITDEQFVASGHPLYWDQATDTAWTSYLVGRQWHESFVENADSLFLIARQAERAHLGGLGIWALGMDGNAPDLLPALQGSVPATTSLSSGPTETSPSAGPAGPAPSGSQPDDGNAPPPG